VNPAINTISIVPDYHSVLSPLTGSADVELLDEVNVVDLKAMWFDTFGVDVADEFSGVDALGLYRCPESGLQFFHPPIVGSESFYEALQRLPWYYLEEKPEYEFARGFISRGYDVLEVGCGRGEFAKKIVARSYVGLELSRKAQEMAAAAGIRVIIEPVETHCSLREQRYDVVCAFQVLEHVANPLVFIESCIRCLKSGGLLIYSVPNADSYIAYVNSVLGMPPHHVTSWVEPALKYVASRFGMDIVAMDRERLADVHVADCAAVLTRELLVRCLGAKKPRRLIDGSRYFKILNKLAIHCSRPLAKVLLEADRLRPIGHSITVVLRK
jgi:SAM-dependent methyltransferase